MARRRDRVKPLTADEIERIERIVGDRPDDLDDGTVLYVCIPVRLVNRLLEVATAVKPHHRPRTDKWVKRWKEISRRKEEEQGWKDRKALVNDGMSPAVATKKVKQKVAKTLGFKKWETVRLKKPRP